MRHPLGRDAGTYHEESVRIYQGNIAREMVPAWSQSANDLWRYAGRYHGTMSGRRLVRAMDHSRNAWNHIATGMLALSAEICIVVHWF